jgi:SAM-dependent methyltransferase
MGGCRRVDDDVKKATPGGFDPGHYAPLFDAEDRHFWFRARNLVLETIVRSEIAGLSPGYRVLEVGCGTGYVLRMLDRICSEGLVLGMDLFIEGLRISQRRSAVRLVQGRVEQPPFRLRFDIIGLFDTLEHVEDDLTVLRHLRNMLAERGKLLITVPAYQALWSDFDVESHHCRRYEPASLERKLVAAGFVVEYLTPFMATLYPVARAGRFVADTFRKRRSGSQSAVREQLEVRPGVNELMAFLLAQEAKLVARRRRLPIGTSLLALARAK